METIYIISDKGKLSKTGNHLIFCDIYGQKKTIFPFKTKSIFIDKPISITAEAFVLIAENHIQLFFNTYNPNNNFIINYNTGSILLKQKQFALLENKSKSLSIAKAIVKGKIENQLYYINRIKRNNLTIKENINLDKIISRMKVVLKKVPMSENSNTLRGYEGITAKLYFSVLKHHIKPQWAIFDKRSQHPPKTNVNAVLSYLYTLLTNNITCILQKYGFDTMIGIFHDTSSNKNALSFDLVEEYRNTIADPLCCSLFNLGILKENDFENISTAETGVFLTKEGRMKVIQTFEDKLEKTTFYTPLNKSQKYIQIIEEQVLSFRKAILNDVPYLPFQLK